MKLDTQFLDLYMLNRQIDQLVLLRQGMTGENAMMLDGTINMMARIFDAMASESQVSRG